MAVKVADTIESMADFPAMMAESVNIVKADDTEKSLQAMYDDGELGGGGSGLPLPEQKDMLLKSYEVASTGDLNWKQVPKSDFDAIIEQEDLTSQNKVVVINADHKIETINPNTCTYEELGEILTTFSGLNYTTDIDSITGAPIYRLTYDREKYSFKVTYGIGDDAGDIIYIGIGKDRQGSFIAYRGSRDGVVSHTCYRTAIIHYYGDTVDSSDTTKVYAKNIELATREYVDKHGGSGGSTVFIEGQPVYGARIQYATNKQIPLNGQASLKYTITADGILTGSCHKKGQGYSAWLHMNGKSLTTFDNYGGEGCSFDFPNVRVKAGDVIELSSNVPTSETTNFFWLNNIGVTPIVGMEAGAELELDIFYKAGDHVTLANSKAKLVVGGHVTGDTQYIEFSIPLAKRLKAGQKVTISELKTNIRQNGKYLVANYKSGGYDILLDMNVYVCENGENYIYVELKVKSGTIANATNNTECSIQIEALDIVVS